MRKNLNYLYLPTNTIVKPSIEVKRQVLPLEELSWEDFERLCLRLIEKKHGIENCEIYGIKGQKQQGIDIYAKSTTAKHLTYQCKRVKDYTPKEIEKAVQKFQEGKWFSETNEFYLCTASALNRTEQQDKLREIKEILKKDEIKFVKWDKGILSRTLKKHPDLVYDFFGKEWVKQFCGKEFLTGLKSKFLLDSNGVIEYRKELGQFYSTVFNIFDPGLAIQEVSNNPFPIIERYVIPDFIEEVKFDRFFSEKKEREVKPETDIIMQQFLNQKLSDSDRSSDSIENSRISEATTAIIRNSIDIAMPRHKQNIVVGDPGSGKSTLLRFIVLDIFSNRPKLSSISKNWGKLLPVYIPFAFIAKNLSLNNNLSISEIMHLWLQSYDAGKLFSLVKCALDDRRLLLLIDGIDEWSNVSVARQAISKLEVFSANKEITMVYTSRPYGLKFLTGHLTNVKVNELAPFSKIQQEQFSYNWFRHWTNANKQHTGNDYSQNLANQFIKELNTNSDLKTLSPNPLLLSIILVQRLRNSVLPKNKFEAFAKITSYLINEHPLKRKSQANISDNNTFEISNYMEDIFSFLAFEIQQKVKDAVIPKKDAKNVIARYLKATYGYDKTNSIKYADQLIDLDASNLGIIIEKSPEEVAFVHRQFQEYLASKYLFDSDRDLIIEILDKNSLNPVWYQVILSLFFHVKREQEFNEYLNIIKSVSPTTNNNNYKNTLLFEIAITSVNSPIATAKSFLQQSILYFENESYLPFKKKLLNIILSGLNNPKIGNYVLQFIRNYFPNLNKYGDYRLHSLRGLPENKITDSLVRFLKLNLINGDVRSKLSASQTVRHFINVPLVYDMVITLLKRELDTTIRAFAINSMVSDKGLVTK